MKRKNLIVLIDFARWDMPSDDFAKDAVGICHGVNFRKFKLQRTHSPRSSRS